MARGHFKGVENVFGVVVLGESEGPASTVTADAASEETRRGIEDTVSKRVAKVVLKLKMKGPRRLMNMQPSAYTAMTYRQVVVIMMKTAGCTTDRKKPKEIRHPLKMAFQARGASRRP